MQFNQLILEKTPLEDELEDKDSYWYRRLVNAEYFRDLAAIVVK